MSHISYVQPYIDELPYYLRDRTYISRYRNSFNSSPAQRLRKDAQGGIKTSDLWLKQPGLQSGPMQIHRTNLTSILLLKDLSAHKGTIKLSSPEAAKENVITATRIV
ncbi:hypothetical protein Zmor_000325 [Zophobas morio]|uniref:Uncharacterized protein n=1 Tax=Zophobas morio TaxID=2755281 RepID=A0AA38J472_9CUCU|nr:hypothetical protein Zmor_000325 [Zophobas morio]